MTYVVLQTIWHSKDAKHYEPGEKVSLDHLKPEEIKVLVDDKIVAPAEGAEPRAAARAARTTESPRGNVNPNPGEGG